MTAIAPIRPTRLPRMRKENLIVDELPDEVLVYDLDRHKAHCLNQTAALVWKRCDGRSTPRAIARRLQSELDQPFGEDLVWLALRQLNKIHLLEGSLCLPAHLAGMSRREMVRAMGPGAVIVDVSIDQGGTCETSRPTTHHDPVYVEEGVVHYCVANMPGAVPITSTAALTAATLPYVLKLANLGTREALLADVALAKGVLVSEGSVTYAALAESLHLPYVPLEQALPA